MTTITAQVIADSRCQYGRITTMELHYPRFIHAELLTHRKFSKNSGSSRAIPVAKAIGDIRVDPAMPEHWGKNQKGMQADEECDAPILFLGMNWSREGLWLHAMDYVTAIAEAYSDAGYHKQVANRLAEPFAHITVVVTSTEWENFFSLRNHPAAQPEMQILAREMKEALAWSVPKELGWHEWHLPYVDDNDVGDVETLKLISAGRCARGSYGTFGRRQGGRPDDELALDLLCNRHMSPFEHQATPAYGSHYNLDGWRSFRNEIETAPNSPGSRRVLERLAA